MRQRQAKKNKQKHQRVVLIMTLLTLLFSVSSYANVFDRIYKLPNAQIMTAENNYQPNVYFIPSTQPTTKEGKTLLKNLIASHNNKTIESNLNIIKQLLLKAIKQKDPVAQAIQGMMYYYGWHSSKNYKAAYVHFKKASQQGEGQGDYMLSQLIDKGYISLKDDQSYSLNELHQQPQKSHIVTLPDGRTKDLGIAITALQGIRLLSKPSSNKALAKLQRAKLYLNQGVIKNHAQSQYEYGNSIVQNIFKPLDIKPDNKTEFSYFIKAADQGWPEAINDTSAFYSLMRGSIDRKKANYYAEQLIATKDMHYDKAWGMRIKNHYNANEKDEAKALLKKGWALSNHQSASLAALHNYFIDSDTKANALKKLRWAQTAYQLQNPHINEIEVGILFTEIGKYYLKGILGTDIKEAKKWLNRSVAEGGGLAYNSLGLICDGYYGEKKDIACSVKNYQKGVNMLEPLAMQNLAVNYFKGEGVVKNHLKFFELTKQVALMGRPHSMRLLAIAYNEGVGTKRDISQCFIWANLSKLRGWKVNETRKLAKRCGQSLNAGHKAHLQRKINTLNQSIPISNVLKITEFK